MSKNQVDIEEKRDLLWRVSRHIIRGLNGFAITYIHVLMDDDYKYYKDEKKLNKWIDHHSTTFKRGDIHPEKMEYHANILKEMLRLCALCQRNIDSRNKLFRGIQLRNDTNEINIHNIISGVSSASTKFLYIILPIVALFKPQYLSWYAALVGKNVVSNIPEQTSKVMNWFRSWFSSHEAFIQKQHKINHDPQNLQKVNEFIIGNYDVLWYDKSLGENQVVHDPPLPLAYVEKSIMHRFASDARHVYSHNKNKLFQLLSISSDAGGLDACTKAYALRNFPPPENVDHVTYLLRYNHPNTHKLPSSEPNYSMIMVEWKGKTFSIAYPKQNTERSVRNAHKDKLIVTIEVRQQIDHIHRFFPYYALRSICLIFSCRDPNLNLNMLSEWETNNGSAASSKYVSFIKDVSQKLIETCKKNKLYCKEVCQGAKLNMYDENTWSGKYYGHQAQIIMKYLYDRNYYRYPVVQWSGIVSQNDTGLDLNSPNIPELFKYDYTCGTFYYQKVQHETITLQAQLWEGIKQIMLSMKYFLEKLTESLGYANPYLFVFQAILASGSIYVVGRLLYKFMKAVFKSRRIKHASRAVRYKIQSAKQLMIQNPTPENVRGFISTVRHTPTFDFDIVLKASNYLDRPVMYHAVEVIKSAFNVLQVSEVKTDPEKNRIKVLRLDMNEVIVASDIQVFQHKIKKLMVQNALMISHQHVDIRKKTHPAQITFIVPIEPRIIVESPYEDE